MSIMAGMYQYLYKTSLIVTKLVSGKFILVNREVFWI